MNEINLEIFVKRNIRVNSDRKKQKLVASCSDSVTNPIAELRKKNKHSVEKVPPFNTDVSPVCDVGKVDHCGVLISQQVLKTIQHLLQ